MLGTGDYNKSALAVLERYADPRALKKLGRKRLSTLLIRSSRGQWRESKADDLLIAADESIELWAGGGLDFEELAADIATEVRLLRNLNAEITALAWAEDGRWLAAGYKDTQDSILIWKL